MKESRMRFKVIPNESKTPNEGRDVGYLWTDNWDDWFEFSTLYVLTYFDFGGVKHDIGGVKIGQFDMVEKQRRPKQFTSSVRIFRSGFHPLRLKAEGENRPDITSIGR